VWSTVPVCCTSSAISALRLSRNSTRSYPKPLSRKGCVPELDWPPPDLGKRRPGAGGTAAGSKLKKSSTKIERRKNTKARHSNQEKAEKVVRRHLSVTSGTITIGCIDGEGSRFTATDLHGVVLGVFGSLREAANAVSSTFNGDAR
jgi:hypothetical protein